MAGARNRYLNITAASNSKAAKAYAGRHVKTSPPNAAATKAGKGGAAVDLHYYGGRTITDLTFTNFYLGGAAWAASDRRHIDSGITALMTDPWCLNVVDQYEITAPTSNAAKSVVLTDSVTSRYYTSDVEAHADDGGRTTDSLR